MKHLLTLIAFFFLIMFPIVLTAQPGLPITPDQAPIDGGFGILAALGGAYAIKKLKGHEQDRRN